MSDGTNFAFRLQIELKYTYSDMPMLAYTHVLTGVSYFRGYYFYF